MIVVRIGDGHSSSGKILDRNTHWYIIEEKKGILDRLSKYPNKRIYIRNNNSAYKEITKEHLYNLIEDGKDIE